MPPFFNAKRRIRSMLHLIKRQAPHMKSIIQELKELYQSRSIPLAESFCDKWFSDNEPCVLTGTCVGELCIGKQEIKTLIENDLKYWYDLTLDEASAVATEIDKYTLWQVKGTLTFAIHENKQRYKRFVGICDAAIEDESLSTTQKAAGMIYTLSALLAVRQHKRRTCSKIVLIDIILKGEKIIFINFSLDKDLDHADSFLEYPKALNGAFSHEKARMAFDHDECLESAVAAMGYENVSLNKLDDQLFFGIGTKRAVETLDDRLYRLFKAYKQESDYDSLFQLRLQMAYLFNIYSFSQQPHAIVRFFGMCDGDEVNIIHFRYPNYFYIEDR